MYILPEPLVIGTLRAILAPQAEWSASWDVGHAGRSQPPSVAFRKRQRQPGTGARAAASIAGLTRQVLRQLMPLDTSGNLSVPGSMSAATLSSPRAALTVTSGSNIWQAPGGTGPLEIGVAGGGARQRTLAFTGTATTRRTSGLDSDNVLSDRWLEPGCGSLQDRED